MYSASDVGLSSISASGDVAVFGECDVDAVVVSGCSDEAGCSVVVYGDAAKYCWVADAGVASSVDVAVDGDLGAGAWVVSVGL